MTKRTLFTYKHLKSYCFLGLFFYGFLMHAAITRDTLVVAIYQDPPFVIKTKNSGYEGLCIDLWEELANSLQKPFVYKEFNDEIGLIRTLDYNEADLSINPLNVSQNRLEKFKVTQPFFISSIGVAYSSSSQSQFSVFVSNFFSTDFLKVVLLLLFIIFIFGTILWLIERKYNKHQFRPGILGIFDGLWWSAVTMTTVGYGDKAPKTTIGKTLAIIWMFTAIIIISSFTATIASTLTVSSLGSKIESIEDLKVVKNIGTVGASGGEDFLKVNKMYPKNIYATPIEALRALAKQEVEAVVYDKTILHYLINSHQMNGKVRLLPITFNKQYRSFIFPKNSNLYDKINPLLVHEIQKSSWQNVLKKYNLKD